MTRKTQNPAPLNDRTIQNLVAIGLGTDLAQKVVGAGYTLSRLKSTTRHLLTEDFTREETERIWLAVQRKPIPAETLQRFADECDWKCCMCWNIDTELPVIIHHIEEHSKTQNDSYENLVVLCLNHHAEAHSTWTISRPPCPPELLLSRKKDWIRALADFKEGRRVAPGREVSSSGYMPATAPAPTAHFVGRLDYRTDVQKVLRLRKRVAISGMGGIGKSATALRIAADMSCDFEGGSLWCSLSDSDGQAEPVLHQWLNAIIGHSPPSINLQGLVDRVRSMLAERQSQAGPLLVILDDVRAEWIEAARAITSALPDGSAVLITTRDSDVSAVLNAMPCHLSEMNSHEALQAFQGYSNVTLTYADRKTALSLMEVLGYLPLAIELAGKHHSLWHRKPGYTLLSLLDAVQERAIKALVLPGHRGLAATFSVTYASLSTEVQRLFRCAGAFASGPIPAHGVAGLIKVDIAEAESILDTLVLSSLLAWGKLPQDYMIHPLLRQYARHILEHEPADEALSVITAHLEYYLALAETNASTASEAHAKLETAFPNLMQAFDFAVRSGKNDAVNRLATALWPASEFMPTRGYFQTAQHVLGKAISACRSMGNLPQQAAHTGNLGTAYARMGQMTRAAMHYNEALAISRKTGDRYNESAYLSNLGQLLKDTGKLKEAEEIFRQALDAAEEGNNLDVALDILGNLASFDRRLGRYREAEARYRVALSFARELGNSLSEGNNLSNLGLIYLDAGKLEDALRCIQDALDISRRIGDRAGEANRSGHLGRICLEIGQPEQALLFLEDALKLCRQIGDRPNEGAWIGNGGIAYRKLGEMEKALDAFERALAISLEVNEPEMQGLWLLNIAVSCDEAGKYELAASKCSDAYNILNSVRSLYTSSAERLLNKLNAR